MRIESCFHWNGQSVTLPFHTVCGPAPRTSLSNTHAWPMFTRTGWDQVRLFLQLWVHPSYDRIEWCMLHTMRGPNLPLCEWFRVLPLDVSGCPVLSVHILQHLSLLCTWGKRWCAPPVVICILMADNSIYQGLSLVGNLWTSVHMGEVSSFATLDQWPNLHNGDKTTE